MRSHLMLTAAAFALFAAAPAMAQVPTETRTVDLHPPLKRDYLVETGKRPVFASERLAQAFRGPLPANPITSAGQFVQQGKAIVWVPNEQLPEFLARQKSQVATSRTKSSSGRFIQQGKVHIWQENDG